MKISRLVYVVLGLFFIVALSFSNLATDESSYIESSGADEYVLLAWNDLGMHCANNDFTNIAVLPPYNNVFAQVIKRGSPISNPEISTSNLKILYKVIGNSYSAGKTNFWDYEDALFGVSLPENIGLTGNGMTGELQDMGDHFFVSGIPLTPFNDNNLSQENPYQLGYFKLKNNLTNANLAFTGAILPVSGEIGCVSSGCHSSEMDILQEHSDDMGFDPNDTPILCASCHSSNALGTAGAPGLGSLSEVIHKKHADKTNDCYSCHPGSQAQCQRGIMYALNMECQDCHGSVADVGESISEGREPWLEEPSCGAASCHGSTYAEEPGTLFRESQGHGGLYCSACHGSPHAILPSTLKNDNYQNIKIQGYAGTLSKCDACHGYTPDGPGPHGIMANAFTQPNGTSFSVNNCGSGTQFSWDPVPGATVYEFYMQRTFGGKLTFIRKPSVAGFNISAHIPNGLSIQYQIRAKGPSGLWSQWTPITTYVVNCSGEPYLEGLAKTGEEFELGGLFDELAEIYPVPAQDVLNIILLHKVESTLQVQVFNIKGERVYKSKIDPSFKDQWEIPVNDLPPGNYIINLSGAEQNFSKKFIKL